MNTRLVCGMAIGAVTVMFGSRSALHGQHEPHAEIAKDVMSALPERVALLASWPTAKQQVGKVVQTDASYDTRDARRNSISWIQEIIDPRWLPDNPEKSLGAKLTLLEKAYDRLDTSHVQWEKNGHHLRVSQTSAIFYLSVTSAHGKIAEGDAIAKRVAIRTLVSKLVKNVAEIYGSGNEGPGRTGSVLMECSFDRGKVLQFADGMVSLPARIDFENKLDRQRWNCWWRKTFWWTNGDTLGLCTVKSSGGAWVPTYNGKTDEEWFSLSSSKHCR